ncbi:MAG: NAD(P)-dependent glycerol-3-phosphate dehydrogenase [Dehalococcoidia bacterium]|nr:NAD(P)-dependent glycerol-3-phosphate dehydrogenase [Dehalococcoidia bacterium]
MSVVTVVGATSWGTTLGIIIARQGHDVRLLARTEDEAVSLESRRENARFVPGFPFPDSMHARADADAFSGADLALLAVPSHTLRENIRRVGSDIAPGCIVVSAVKGLELNTGRRMSEILREELPNGADRSICALSGPNLASEIVRGMPAPTVIASPNQEAALQTQAIINSSVFRVYTNADIVGVEFCGALKNIIALGAGICDGLDLGDNAKSGFMTRGLAEIARLGIAAGASPATFAGLAGMGDLVATCSSVLSRNHYVGEQLAAGKSLSDIRSSMQNVAEGVYTTSAALELAHRLDVEMPITRVTQDVLTGVISAAEAVHHLMGRHPTSE